VPKRKNLFTGDECGMQRLQGRMDKITSVYSNHYRCINQKSKGKQLVIERVQEHLHKKQLLSD
jgi:hypothetical protein